MCELIKKYEGLRLDAYKCPRGVWTIGYGNTSYPDGRPVQAGDVISQTAAEALWSDYLIKEVYTVYAKIPYHLTQRQKDALASLIFNWNSARFLKSKLYTAICAKDWAEVCRQWDFGFKNGLLGLFKRRTEELALFMKDAR